MKETFCNFVRLILTLQMQSPLQLLCNFSWFWRSSNGDLQQILSMVRSIICPIVIFRCILFFNFLQVLCNNWFLHLTNTRWLRKSSRARALKSMNSIFITSQILHLSSSNISETYFAVLSLDCFRFWSCAEVFPAGMFRYSQVGRRRSPVSHDLSKQFEFLQKLL